MLDVKTNYRNKYLHESTSLQCDECKSGQEDDQVHVTLCSALKCNQDLQLDYNKLFSKDLDIVKNAIATFEVSWREKCEMKSQMNT